MQNEVVEEKTKKPFSKKRIVAIVALSLVAVLLLVPVVNQCIIELFNGELYEQDGFLQNTHIYAENAYVEDGVIHYTIVNDTIKELDPRTRWPSYHDKDKIILEQYVDGEWVKCELSGLPPLGNKGYNRYDPDDSTDDSAYPIVPAFGELEWTYDYEYFAFDLQEGEYRLWALAVPRYTVFSEFFTSFYSYTRGPKGCYFPVYFSIPAAS